MVSKSEEMEEELKWRKQFYRNQVLRTAIEEPVLQTAIEEPVLQTAIEEPIRR